jgi:pyrimidine-specific ribonucleoside hydrolase
VLLAAPIPERRFVGKNVCHTLLYDRDLHATMPAADPHSPAQVLFMAGMEAYLKMHDVKKWHDPTAAACHLHPEIGTWARGRVMKIEGGWGTVADDTGDLVLADVDRDRLWGCFRSWK